MIPPASAAAGAAPGAVSTSAPAAPGDRLDPNEVVRVIELLGDKSLKVRDEAGGELLKLGESAREAMEKVAMGTSDPEIQFRLEGLLAELRRREKELILELGGSVSMKLLRVFPGKFRMGSPDAERDRLDIEGPQHEVTISQAFHIGAYEVTRAQFAAFVKDANHKTDAEKDGWSYAWDGKTWLKAQGASWKGPGFEQTDEHPAVCVSHNDATAFCEWLGRKTGKKAALPTEAQWEYACRAGTRTAYQWGDNPEGGKGWCNAADLAARRQFPNWGAFPWDDGHVFTAPVGRFNASAFGLYDMHGNVWEWCADWYDEKYYANAKDRDPQGPPSGRLRVMRGGSWGSVPGNCRSALRNGTVPGNRSTDLGFRVIVAGVK